MHVSPYLDVGGWMWQNGGEVKRHNPWGGQEEEQSDLFKTHTIWVARLQAQDGTAACVSEVKTRKEEKREKKS